MLAYGSISIMWPLDRVFQSAFGNVDLVLCRFDPPKFLHIVPVQIFGLSEPSVSISYYSSVYFSPQPYPHHPFCLVWKTSASNIQDPERNPVT